MKALLQMERLFIIQAETFIPMVYLEEITKIFKLDNIRFALESPQHCFINQDLRDLWHRLLATELIFILGFVHSMVVHIVI